MKINKRDLDRVGLTKRSDVDNASSGYWLAGSHVINYSQCSCAWVQCK